MSSGQEAGQAPEKECVCARVRMLTCLGAERRLALAALPGECGVEGETLQFPGAKPSRTIIRSKATSQVWPSLLFSSDGIWEPTDCEH